MGQDRRHLLEELAFFALQLFVQRVKGREDIRDFRIDALQDVFQDQFEGFDGNDDEKGRDQQMAEGDCRFSEQHRKNQEDDGGEKRHEEDDQRPGHEVVEFRELWMRDDHQDEVGQHRQDDVGMKRQAGTGDIRKVDTDHHNGNRGGNGQIEDPLPFGTRGPFLQMNQQGQIAQPKPRARVSMGDPHQVQIDGGKNIPGINGNADRCRQLQSDGSAQDNMGFRQERLLVQQRAGEGDGQRGDGQQAQHFNHLEEIPWKDAVKKRSPRVQKQRRADPGESPVQGCLSPAHQQGYGDGQAYCRERKGLHLPQ